MQGFITGKMDARWSVPEMRSSSNGPEASSSQNWPSDLAGTTRLAVSMAFLVMGTMIRGAAFMELQRILNSDEVRSEEQRSDDKPCAA